MSDYARAWCDRPVHARRIATRRFGAWCDWCDDWVRDVYHEVIQRASWKAADRLAGNHERFDHREGTR